MRKLILLLCIIGSLSNIYAQKALLQKINGEGGLSKQFTKLEDAEQVPFSPGNARNTFGLNANSDLVLMRTEPDKLGLTHYRYYQTYHNIPVENSMYIAHIKSGKLTSMSGTIVTQFDSKIDQKSGASLSGAQAIKVALNYMHGRMRILNNV
jgi:bacillolysin